MKQISSAEFYFFLTRFSGCLLAIWNSKIPTTNRNLTNYFRLRRPFLQRLLFLAWFGVGSAQFAYSNYTSLQQKESRSTNIEFCWQMMSWFHMASWEQIKKCFGGFKHQNFWKTERNWWKLIRSQRIISHEKCLRNHLKCIFFCQIVKKCILNATFLFMFSR